MRVGSHYRIQNLQTGKCVDLKTTSKSKSVEIVQKRCNLSSRTQLWSLNLKKKFTTVTSAYSNLKWDVSGNSKSNGANIIQYSSHGGSNQLFNIQVHSYIKKGDKFTLIEDKGTVTVSWSQNLIPWERDFRVFHALEHKLPHRVIPIFIQNGYWKHIKRGLQTTITISSGMKYAGSPRSPGFVVLEDRRNKAFQKRYFNALPKSWSQWVGDNLKPKDAKKMAQIALKLRNGAKKAALKMFKSFAGKKLGRAANGMAAIVDPTHWFSTWSGDYLRTF